MGQVFGCCGGGCGAARSRSGSGRSRLALLWAVCGLCLVVGLLDFSGGEAVGADRVRVRQHTEVRTSGPADLRAWQERIAIADAMVAVRRNRFPRLPDSLQPRPNAGPAGEAQLGAAAETIDVVELEPNRQNAPPATREELAPRQTPPGRTEGPEIEVRVRVSHQCPDCDRLLREMKYGLGRRQIVWAIRDYGLPETGHPQLVWTARGRNWVRAGFCTRLELESMIQQTEGR
jgi:hypothetical protein